MNLPTPISLPMNGMMTGGSSGENQFESIPATPGVYRIVPLQGESHISWSSNLRRRVKRLVSVLQAGVQRIDCWPAGSKLDSALLLYQLTRSEFPNSYLRRLRLRTPWFLSLSEGDPYPQLVIAHRISSGSAVVLGPFGSRDTAQAYLESTLSLFQTRRCPGMLAPAPDHPGCLYGEIGQCLRPCQCAVSSAEYASEVERLTEFLLSDGRSMIRNLSVARTRASDEMEFEAAAQAHKRLEKVKAAVAVREPEVGDVRRFCGIALTRAQEPHACQLRPMLNGHWQDTVTFSLEQSADQSRSIDTQLRDRLSALLRAADTSGDPSDHLAMFGRWLRSSWCDGEWFPFQTLDNLDYRKLVRRMSKLIQASVPAANTPGH